MTLRIFFLIVLRVHLVIMAVQSGGLLGFEDLTPETQPVTWFSEELAVANTPNSDREEALFVDVSASSDTQYGL